MKNSKKYLKGSKGSIQDVLTLMVLPFTLLIIIILGFYFNYSFGNSIKDLNLPGDTNNVIRNVNVNNGNNVGSYMDFLFAFVLFGAFVGVIAISYMLGNNPMFMLFYAIIGVAMTILSFLLGAVGSKIASAGGLSQMFATMPMTVGILNNLVIVNIIFLVGVGIALYAKPGAGSGEVI